MPGYDHAECLHVHYQYDAASQSGCITGDSRSLFRGAGGNRLFAQLWAQLEEKCGTGECTKTDENTIEIEDWLLGFTITVKKQDIGEFSISGLPSDRHEVCDFLLSFQKLQFSDCYLKNCYLKKS